MYEVHPNFEKPESENAKIWRYMDFTKFIAMLDSGCLYFCRGDTLRQEDPWEGSLADSELLKKIPQSHAEQFVEKMQSCGPPITVNCWHLNEYESVAMWKLYSDIPYGIAIQSTYKRLVEVVNKCPDTAVHIGKVRYIDYEKEGFTGWLNIFSPFLTKRKSFEHENELRAMIWETGKDTQRDAKGGVLLPIDLNRLIESIYISPNSRPWFLNLVESVNRKYSTVVPVNKSPLLEGPLY